MAGPGNNGGDGFVAARHLGRARLLGARQLRRRSKARLKGDAALAAERWSGPVEAASPASLTDCDLVIDALFGAGLDREVEGLPRAMIEAMNAAGVPVVAVDLPSGVNGTTGAVMGVAVNAAHTVTFFRRKIGHLLLPGRLHCGAIHVADIGIPGERAGGDQACDLREPTGAVGPRLSASRGRTATNIRRGHAVVVSGGLPTTGARRGWRRVARYGQGRDWSPLPARARRSPSMPRRHLAIMVRPVDGASELAAFLADKRHNAVLLGPGGGVGPAMREQVAVALASGAAVVLDADALTSFAQEPEALAGMIAKGRETGRRPDAARRRIREII